jgi:hypothetical protein
MRGALQPRWLIVATLAAVVVGIVIAVMLFDALAGA